MQLILEPEENKISISEKMSALNQETDDQQVSKGEVKELLVEVNGKTEVNCTDKEIENKENVTANAEDHKESGDTSALQPSNLDDNLSGKSEELNNLQCESNLTEEITMIAKDPQNVQEIKSVENGETSNDEHKDKNINLNITEESNAEIDQSKSHLDAQIKNDIIQETLPSDQFPVEQNEISDVQDGNLKEVQMDIDEDKEVVEEHDIKKQDEEMATKTLKESQMDIVEDKEVVQGHDIKKQNIELATKTLNDIVEPMEIDFIGRNLEEEVSESISAMVNEIVENLNQDDSIDFLDSSAAKTKSLEMEITFEDKNSSNKVTKADSETKIDGKNNTNTEANMETKAAGKKIIEHENIDKFMESESPLSENTPNQCQILDTIPIAPTDLEPCISSTMNERKINEHENVDNLMEGKSTLSDNTPNQCQNLDTVSIASTDLEPCISSTMNENDDKILQNRDEKSPDVDAPFDENNAMENDNPENSTTVIAVNRNAQDELVVEKSTEHQDSAEKAIPVESELSETTSKSGGKNGQCVIIEKVDVPFDESNAMENNNPENSTTEIALNRNAQDELVVKKSTEHRDSAEKPIPVESELSETISKSDGKTVQCEIVEKEEKAQDNINKEVPKLPERVDENIVQTTVNKDNTCNVASKKEVPKLPTCVDEDNVQKTVNEDNTFTAASNKKVQKLPECVDEKNIQKTVNENNTCTAASNKEVQKLPECVDEKNVQKTVNKDITCTVASSESEPIIEKSKDAAATDKHDSIQNIIPEHISKENKQISDDIDEVKIVEDNTVEAQPQEQQGKTSKTMAEAKQCQSIIKLSNTMDILSDDDEDEGSKEAPKVDSKPQQKETESADKHCINLDDDDDVMVIDEETSKDDKIDKPSETSVAAEPKDEDKVVELDTSKEDESKEAEAVKEIGIGLSKSYPESKEAPKLESEKVTKEVSEKPSQLVPDDFFKTYRKNLADMTRDDLEEFCILKIVESIIDRSNINEIRSKLKTMSQTVEEYKKKATMLTKQNRDLQVVLKSVQEEQKKSTNQSITPLKIMRSVGMQVLMTDKSRRRPPGPAALNSPTTSNINPINNNVNNNTNTTITRQPRNTNQSPRATPVKQANNNQQIPVPRLVPAAQNMANRNLAGPPPPAKTNNVQNGIKVTSPSQKVPEKRPHARVQSVTVDLTDDEPPSKVPAKNSPAPPVRLVNTQNLLAQRPQNPQALNSPRKVFIPINLTGPSTQNVRPGQTVLLKTPSPQGPRPRGPAALPTIRPKQNNIPIKRVQGARHPAPLPDAMKQYQPPNWKALPPAPDLKLSKVENGIVISWKIEGYQEDSYEEIASYQLYAYQETSAPPNTALWKKIGDVKALPLPMACTLTQFMAGYKYYFAVRAVDIRSRLGPFSLPGSILLLNKM